jgi:membrane protease YdiL (CAAX protease family)
MGRVRHRQRLAVWVAAVAFLSTIAYVGRALEGKPERDLLYRYDTAVAGAIQYAILFGIVIALAVERLDLLALRRPRSWLRALGLAFGVVVAVFVANAALEPFLHAGREQGYTPPAWDPGKAHQYAANFVVIALVAPIVEELLFRGLGYSLLEQFGRWPAIVVVGIAFAAVHGLVAGFLVLALFGGALAWLRARTGSVIPGMLVHGTFNAIALIAAVAT